jgi:hypothetical protein
MSTETGLRAMVVYESLFGNTRTVAEAVAEGLRAEGIAVTLADVRHAPAADEVLSQVLVVGAPTHAFSLSRPSTRRDAVRQGAAPDGAGTGLREWLDAMPPTRAGERLGAAFDTRAKGARWVPKAAGTRASHLLGRRGYDLLSRPTGFLVTDVAGPLVEGELDRATAWGRALAAAAEDRLTARSGGAG